MVVVDYFLMGFCKNKNFICKNIVVSLVLFSLLSLFCLLIVNGRMIGFLFYNLF